MDPKFTLEFAKALRGVAAELNAYATALENNGGEQFVASGGLSTYGISAQGVLYDMVEQDVYAGEV